MKQPFQQTRRACVGGLGLLAVTCLVPPALARSGVVRATRMLMGTRVDIVAQGAQAHVAIAEAWAEMQRLEALMSRYRRDSEVAALQRMAGRAALRVSPETFAVLQRAAQLGRLSDGQFDITVGAYDGWCFEPGRVRRPAPEELRGQQRLVDYRQIVLKPGTREVQLRRAGSKLDLGGVGKLPILASGMATLKAHALEGAMINGGGDVLVSGQLEGRDWRVGLRDPARPGRLLGVVVLREGVVASSGDYERSFVRQGRHYHHILDPHTGLPTQGVHGAVLIAATQEEVNGLGATAMLVGHARAQRLLAGLPGVDSLVVGAAGQRWLTPGMRDRIQTVAAG